ncbi:type 1 glutamine amidotransferase [Bifidobacterium xylocopae]|uniref:GMP synthase n=1 Tax=Bifidobacterium xylocopae TaxID=2493119 RepID=A0A366KBI9_9BIFI|nr:type 1 glutamine amidotransferase [Bifidobacterium xylocopae]RBP98737.1 GMP synthase [Bifidobacterium xylocopae]
MAKRTVLVIQHATWERAGRVGEALEDAGLDVETVDVASEDRPRLAAVGDLAGLVLLGGPMRADDYRHYPGLKAETRLARSAVEAELPVLGICLGHQILARALGGRLRTGGKPQRGVEPIRWVASDDTVYRWADRTTPVLEWHADSVGLPPGATLLARSGGTKVEAFRMGSALGLQGHLEVTGPIFEQWLESPMAMAGLKKGRIAQLKEEFEEAEPLMHPLADSVFSAFAARCSTCAARQAGSEDTAGNIGGDGTIGGDGRPGRSGKPKRGRRG